MVPEGKLEKCVCDWKHYKFIFLLNSCKKKKNLALSILRIVLFAPLIWLRCTSVFFKDRLHNHEPIWAAVNTVPTVTMVTATSYLWIIVFMFTSLWWSSSWPYSLLLVITSYILWLYRAACLCLIVLSWKSSECAFTPHERCNDLLNGFT